MKLLALTTLLAVAACAGHTGGDDVTLSDRAVVVDQELKDVMQVLPDRILVTTPRDDLHRRLFGLIGHTFVSGRTKDSAGYVREVLSVERKGDVTTLMTTTSSLDQVIETGTVHATQDYAALDLAELATQSLGGKGEIAIPETVLFDTKDLAGLAVDGVSVTGQVKIEGGTLEFAPKLDLDAEYNHGLQSFSFSASGDVKARVSTAAKLAVKVEQEVASDTWWEEKKPAKTALTLFQGPRARGVVFAGAVPVEYTTTYSIDIGCDLAIAGSFEGRAGGTFAGAVAAGVSWKKGKPLQTPSRSSFRFDAFAESKVGHGIELECSLTLGVKIEIYEVVGAKLSVGPYVKYATNAEKKRLDMWWGVEGKLEGSFGVVGHELTLAPENPLFTWPSAKEDKPMKSWPLK